MYAEFKWKLYNIFLKVKRQNSIIYSNGETKSRHLHSDLNKIMTSMPTTTNKTAPADNPTIPSTGNDLCVSEDFK